MHFYLFSHIPYEFLSQRPQKIAREVLNLGHRVTFINPPWNVLSLMGRRLLKIGDSSNNHNSNLKILPVPLYGIPKIKHAKLPVNITQNQLLKYYQKNLYSKINQNETNVAIIQDPKVEPFLIKDKFDCISYDCFDDISVLAENKFDTYRKHQKNLVSKSSLIFFTSDTLKDDIQSVISTDIPLIQIPNGVNYKWFIENSKRHLNLAKSNFLRTPIIGYVGALYEWIDIQLILDTAEKNPDLTFLLIGPTQKRFGYQKFSKLNNVIQTGEVPYEYIPSLINKFDVGILPFKKGPIAESTDPIKLYEYFSLGKPVVSTPMRQLSKYRDNGLLLFAKNSEDFSKSIYQAIKMNSPELVSARQKIAEEHSWTNLCKRMIAEIESVITTRHIN